MRLLRREVEALVSTRHGAYEQTAHVTGAGEYRAAFPFPVTIAPAQLVTAS